VKIARICATLAALAAAAAGGCAEYLGEAPALLDSPLPGAAPAARTGAAAKSLSPSWAETLGLLSERNPELRALRAAAEAAAREAEQADRAPNPALSASGKVPVGGMPGFDATLMAMQEIELGKRGPRVREAVAGQAVASAEYFAERWSMVIEARKVFLGLLAAQEALPLERQALALARKAEALVGKGLERGGSTRVDALEARVDVSKSELAVRDREREIAAWKRRLETILDLPGSAVSGVRGALGPGSTPPALPSLLERALRGHPDVRRAERRLEQARASVDRAEAKAIPDMTLSVGAMHQEGMEGGGARTSIAFGLGLPIPLLDANRAGTAAAEARVRMFEEESRAVQRRIQGELARAAEDFERARADAAAWRKSILPDLEEAARLAGKAFEAGKLSRLAVLERERKAVEGRLALLRLDLERETALAEIENAAGPPGAR
jgi:cobalt-zinc-cadmium efflux system outer membrane protein